jgi:hypothetical protein
VKYESAVRTDWEAFKKTGTEAMQGKKGSEWEERNGCRTGATIYGGSGWEGTE